MAKENKYRFKTKKEYIEFLTKANDAYYNTGDSELSDEEYDLIRDEFASRFPDDEFLKEVGAKVLSPSFKKVTHKIPMGSQSKVNNLEEFSDWHNKTLEKIRKKFTYLVSEKIDGFSLSLDYSNGNFIQSVTRGDGIIGEDVTENVKKIGHVPLHIKNNKLITIRGEAVLFKSLFEKHFSDKKNPRNAAAGVVRRLDGERCEHLTFMAYDIIIDGTEIKNEEEKFKILKELGFKSPNYIICNSVEEVHKKWQEYEEKIRDELDYEMDGLVVCVNEVEYQNLLGIIDQRPRYSRAYKFSSQKGVSEVIAINFFAGRTGRITPVAIIKPIFLGGVTIQNVTLHNLSEVKKLKISPGCLVELKRAGDVIPKIERVTKHSSNTLNIPSECPACGGPTVEDDKFLMCNNSDCEAKHYENLLHWVKTLEIKGFGDELVNQLNEAGLLSSPADFYKLTLEDISSLERRGEKSGKKVLEELHKKTNISFPMFIKALGIINFSDKSAELVQPYFPNIEALSKASKEDLIKIHGIGEIVAQAIVSGLAQKKSLIKELLKYISILPYEKPNSSGQLSGVSFCFTGVRDKNLEKSIVSLGGKIASGVSKDLTYLVALDPEDSSSKLVKARQLGVKIITLAEAQKKVI